MRQRPDGVTLIAIWHFIAALFGLLGLCGLSIGLIAVWTSPGPQQDTLIATVALMFAALAIILIFGAFAVVGWGLWNLKSWARMAAIVLGVVQLPGFPIGTIIGALTLWYLLSDPDAKAAFGVAEAE